MISVKTKNRDNIKLNKRRLSICPLEIYDSAVGGPLRIGVKSSYSDDLLKNLTAAVIADHLGSRSVDYVRKAYLDDWKRDGGFDPDAFDLQTIHFLDDSIGKLQKYLIANSHNLIYSGIQSICDMTLAKGLGTLRVALDLSSKGLIHEVLTLCRSSLEMIMWAFAIFDLPSEKDPFEFLPEKTISAFKTYFSYAGKYYGYLSRFSHWRKETHIRAFRFDEEYMAVEYASGRNKWEAIANVMLMTRLYAEGYVAKYASLKRKRGCKDFRPEVRKVSKTIVRRQKEWLRFLAELEGQRLTRSFVEVLAST